MNVKDASLGRLKGNLTKPALPGGHGTARAWQRVQRPVGAALSGACGGWASGAGRGIPRRQPVSRRQPTRTCAFADRGPCARSDSRHPPPRTSFPPEPDRLLDGPPFPTLPGCPFLPSSLSGPFCPTHESEDQTQRPLGCISYPRRLVPEQFGRKRRLEVGEHRLSLALCLPRVGRSGGISAAPTFPLQGFHIRMQPGARRPDRAR